MSKSSRVEAETLKGRRGWRVPDWFGVFHDTILRLLSFRVQTLIEGVAQYIRARNSCLR
jgi:hypothetical protein